jgi:hypothetical protein
LLSFKLQGLQEFAPLLLQRLQDSLRSCNRRFCGSDF